MNLYLTRARIISTTLVLCLTAILTIWQIQRGLYKQHLSALPHTEISSHDKITPSEHLAFTTLSGQFLADKVFIQPRSNQKHQPGFQVWVPFQQQNRTVIVSLGFQDTPQVPKKEQVHGQIRYISSSPFSLKEIQTSSTFPLTVAQLDLQYFAKVLSLPLEPYILIIDDANELSLSDASTEGYLKHYSYAGQFFLIGLLLCYYILATGKDNESNDT